MLGGATLIFEPTAVETTMNETGAYDHAMLPSGIRARMVEGVNGLDMHVLEAGAPDRPCVLLLHGFPELAFSWRKVMPALAAAGYYAVAPDQRGYGRTTGWARGYNDDLTLFRLLNMVRDALALLDRLGRREAAAVVGHDFGSSVAAYCALIRPDVFRAVALMSAPFAGPPALPFISVQNVLYSYSRGQTTESKTGRSRRRQAYRPRARRGQSDLRPTRSGERRHSDARHCRGDQHGCHACWTRGVRSARDRPRALMPCVGAGSRAHGRRKV